MNIILTCSECDYIYEGPSEKMLLNKIVMWNHSKKAHPETAERIMKHYQTLPNNFYNTRPTVGTH